MFVVRKDLLLVICTPYLTLLLTCTICIVDLQPPPGHGGQVPLFPVSRPSSLLHQPSLISPTSSSSSHTHTHNIHSPTPTPTPYPYPLETVAREQRNLLLPTRIIVPTVEASEHSSSSSSSYLYSYSGLPYHVAQNADHETTVDVPQEDNPGLEPLSFQNLPIEYSTTHTEVSFYQQMKTRTRAAIAVLSSLITYVSLNSLIRTTNPSAFVWSEEDKEEAHWLSTSHSWVDRKACRWLGICGLSHYRRVRSRYGHRKVSSANQLPIDSDDEESWRLAWTNGTDKPDQWSDAERQLRLVPDYVLEYAPLVHLYSDEQFWPCDIAEHLYHVTPTLNYTPIQPKWEHSTLNDLHKLNDWQDGRYVFLTSNDNVENRPPWLEGERNIPSARGVSNNDNEEEPPADPGRRIELPGNIEDESAVWYDVGEDFSGNEGERLTHDDNRNPSSTDTPRGDEFPLDELTRRSNNDDAYRSRRKGGRSDAPAVLIVVDKGNGIVDAFWFYFYSFNLGNVVLNVRFGNHVGDWEHSLVRFYNGKPKAIFFSEHSSGEAYSYEAVEKIGKRVSAIHFNGS